MKNISLSQKNIMANPLLNKDRYVHMLPDDIIVWEQFLLSPHNIYDHFDYDVRVGDGRDPGPETDEKYRKLGILLSQRRIDVVGFHQTHLAIFEVTREAGLKALGQLTAYPILFQAKYKPNIALKPILIAETLQSDAQSSFERAGITILLFTAP